MNLPSYTKILHLGHRGLRRLYEKETWVEEKIDGSQFAFGLINGELVFRSKRVEVFDGEAGMFQKAITAVKERHALTPLTEDWCYRGEYLQKAKHNCLTYNRVPDGHIVIWDIEVGPSDFLDVFARKIEANRIGFETTTVLDMPKTGRLPISPGEAETFLGLESMLGGPKIEGFVVKTHDAFDAFTGKVLAGKFVSEAFKEKHKKAGNPGGYTQKKDVMADLKHHYRSEARWRKAVQRMRESGECTESPRDIGKLIAYTKADLLEEEAHEIKEKLFKAFSKEIVNASVSGLPEWYKLELLNTELTPA